MTYTELDSYIVRQGPRDWKREKAAILAQFKDDPELHFLMKLMKEVYLMGYNTGSIRTSNALQTAAN